MIPVNRAQILADAVARAAPDSAIFETIRAELARRAQSDGRAIVQLEDRSVVVPVDAELTILAKTLFKERYETAFPTGLRVEIAIGGIVQGGFGQAQGELCSATLFVDTSGNAGRITFSATTRQKHGLP